MSAEEDMYEEMLGAYALDAVSDEERHAIEQYLAVNPQAAQEVREHQEVAALLAWSSMSPPEGLWDRIAGSLDDVAPPPSGDLARVLPLAPVRRKWGRTAAAWVGASAAAAVIAVLAVSVIVDNDSVDPLASAFQDARDDRDSSEAQIMSPDGESSVIAVVDADGHGFLQGADLPSLSDDRTYQLWGVINDNVISLGILGGNPEIEPFSVDAPLTALVLTIEEAGGVVSNGNPDGAWVGELR